MPPVPAVPALPTVDQVREQVAAQVRAAVPAELLAAVPADVLGAAGSSAPAGSPAVFRDVAGPGLGDAVAGEVNGYRAGKGLRTLADDPALDGTAQGWANDIARRDVVEHNGDAHRRGLGENIVISPPGCDARCLVDLWKNSPGHNENLLDPGYRAEGVGVAYGRDGKVFVVQNYRY